ncbi:hypothetical protein B0H16DRAFT_1488008 [Mycena metata]|uniref:Uncharacterized protein n=1 Tax=Mycena metata TaxID=1033252 RepID=A0AAD7KHI7_9AGAR|nr:hypothetical protein B0H16DRAFT_1488008 [Mycena metata]
MTDGTPSLAPGTVDGGVGIGTSYPSPVSTAGSLNVEETSRDTSGGQAEQAGPNPQHSLRAASAALTQAYRRIRQVRRNLVELADPLSSSDSFGGDIGPGHSALMLTASPESSDTDEVIDFNAIRSNLAAVDRQSQEYLERYAPGSWADHQGSPSNVELPRPRRQVQLPSPSSSAEPLQHPVIPPRRSMLESQFARRPNLYNADDPHTFIGRRVAAAEAAGPSRPADTPPQPQVDLGLRAVELEREIIHLRALTTQRRTDPGMAASSRADALSRAEIVRAARSLDMESFRAGHRQQTGNNNPTPRPPSNPRRWRAYRAAPETRQNSNNTLPPTSAHPPASAHPDSRLSMLSNFSVQNLSTPTSAFTRDRPLLFEEPFSYTSGSRRESRDIVESPIGSERSYFIHRRVNADGDELVHNINLEWDDEDPLSWLMSARERGESQDYSAFPRRRFTPPMFDTRDHFSFDTRASRAPPIIQEPRRRGWARLDPDGNAIPSDEEEELERARAEYRIRSAAVRPAVASRRSQSSIDGLEHERSGGAFSNLITRTSISPDDYPTRETASPRVRLNSRDAVGPGGQRLGFGTVMDSVLSVDTRPRHTPSLNGNGQYTYGSSVPFVVDPLPIPLSEMMPPRKESKSRLAGVPVSRNAGFAGR